MSKSFTASFQSVTRKEENSVEPQHLEVIPENINTDNTIFKTLQKNYFTKFKDMANYKPLDQLEPTTIVQSFKIEGHKSRIDAISQIKEPIIIFKSNIGSGEADYQKLIERPTFYSLKNNTLASKENLEKINNQLEDGMRSSFKGIRSSSEQLLDLRFLDFQTYSKAIAEKYTNQLLQSFLKTYGVIQVDEEIYIPERYEVKQKKDHHTLGTQTNDKYVHLTEKPQLTQTTVMKLDIQKLKARKQKNIEYFQLMEQKLVKFFNHVLQNDISLNRMPVVDKIKFVLANLQRYKHQLCEGQSKITLLLFFFKQFQTLKDEKISMEKEAAKRNELQTKRQYSHTPTRQRNSRAQTFKTQYKSKEDVWIT